MFFTGGGWQGLRTTKRRFLRETALTALKATTSTVNSPSLGGDKHKHGDAGSTQAGGPSSPQPAGLCGHGQEAIPEPTRPIHRRLPAQHRPDRHRTQTAGTYCARSKHHRGHAASLLGAPPTAGLAPLYPSGTPSDPRVVGTRTWVWGPPDLRVLFSVPEVADPTAWRRGRPGRGAGRGAQLGERQDREECGR